MAAVTGVVFSGLFVAALVLIDKGPHLGAPDAVYTAFYASNGDSLIVAVGLYLVPLAGIAFLWFATAVRSVLDAIGHVPSAMANGLNLLSVGLFVSMLFAGTAAVAAPAFGSVIANAPVVAPDTARALAALGYGLVFVFSVRGAGMFALTTTTLLRGAGVLGKLPSVIAYLCGAYLLLTATYQPASLLVLPVWVLLISVALVLHERRENAAGSATPAVDAQASKDLESLPDATSETTPRLPRSAP
ncbi:hypothetical protein LQ327_00535 [Actinomycetospora endophytica]|uniref:DUF4386 family protein n=1 Tax=Actinomycetospora endophytica TaxID=2291215 RepID=A0ABS8P0V3_9PSEU|nr:hypothetical protein [Actinomycetospora endophytica]MCD2191875.1 hypothetical protein [Actinomycetospora endophytica]